MPVWVGFRADQDAVGVEDFDRTDLGKTAKASRPTSLCELSLNQPDDASAAVGGVLLLLFQGGDGLLECRQRGLDVGGGGVFERAPSESCVKLVEAVQVLRLNGGRVLLGKPRSSRPDGVAKGSDEYLAVAGAALLPAWNVVELLSGSAKPTQSVVPNRANAVDFDGHEPFASQWLAVP